MLVYCYIHITCGKNAEKLIILYSIKVLFNDEVDVMNLIIGSGSVCNDIQPCNVPDYLTLPFRADPDEAGSLHRSVILAASIPAQHGKNWR